MPEFLETLLVGVTVLYYKSGDTLGMLCEEAIADRGSVVHEIQGVGIDSLVRKQCIDDVCEIREAVFEFRYGWHIA